MTEKKKDSGSETEEERAASEAKKLWTEVAEEVDEIIAEEKVYEANRDRRD